MVLVTDLLRPFLRLFAAEPRPAPPAASDAPGSRVSYRGRRSPPEWSPSLIWLIPLTVAVIGFLLLAAESVVDALGAGDFRDRYRGVLGAAFLLGLPLAGWATVYGLARLSPDGRTQAVLLFVGMAFLGLLVAAAVEDRLGYTAAGLLALVGSLALLFGGRFFSAVGDGDRPRIETNWGGLGGTMGGWSVSSSVVYLLAALFFGGLTVAVGLRAVASVEANPPTSGPPVSADATRGVAEFAGEAAPPEAVRTVDDPTRAGP